MNAFSPPVADYPPAPDYGKFTVLLDDPAAEPGLGFDSYAQALAEIIEHSRPQFAIGIFGDWGSGKTTLMRAIHRLVADKSEVMVPVWFNAWRYEKEEHLIVPLLDSLRDDLFAWRQSQAPEAAEKASRASRDFGRAARAILRGLTLKGTLPGVGEASLDVGKALADFYDTRAEDPNAPPDAASFYHSSFRAMREAIAAFTERGRRRIVVFVDDLDRCLPLSALQVLESMKLFFDEPGFVFVVGLDQAVIERSVEAKYETAGQVRIVGMPTQPVTTSEEGADGGDPVRAPLASLPGQQGNGAAPVSGADYIKKIFQVPFGLPRIGTDQIEEFFSALARVPGLPVEQWQHLGATVKQHLTYMSVGERDSLNPREVKRLINAYTLQLKLLRLRLNRPLNPHVVAALQIMGSRRDWVRLYDLLIDEPDFFVDELKRAQAATADERLWIGDEPLPPAFLNYVQGPAAPLLFEPLQQYISSAEQTRSSDPRLGEALATFRRLKRLLRTMGDDQSVADPNALLAHSSSLHGFLAERGPNHPLASGAIAQLMRLEGEFRQLTSPEPGLDLRATVRRLMPTVDRVGEALLEMRRQARIGASV